MNIEDKAGERAEKVIGLIKDHQPQLRDADGLTEAVMASLSDVKAGEAFTDKKQRGGILLNINFRRLVAAAAILLLGMLGYEQYIVLDKVNRLEVQLEKAAAKQSPAGINTYLNTWETRAMMNFRRIKDNNITFAEKVRRVQEAMKAIDKHATAGENTYRQRAINKYNSMLMR